METICPVDVKYASQISALLQPVPSYQHQQYYEELIKRRNCNAVNVKQDGHFGKGVHALFDFQEGELVLKDEMLVGIQHTLNKMDCLVCSYCFRFIGSVELQIGRRLYFQSLGVPIYDGCTKNTGSCSNSKSSEEDCNEKHRDDDEEDNSLLHDECSISLDNSVTTFKRQSFLDEIVQPLMKGNLSLPYSSKFSLPSPFPCIGGCGEAYYCSEICAERDWVTSHSLLCTGKASACVSRDALADFIQHANETNDIFLLAAKTISTTILRYRKLRSARSDEDDLFSLLLEAWRPFSFGYKKRWWECISLPEDVDLSEESAFRMDIKDLAFKSLNLLKAAILDTDCEPLFSLEIYGNIIGMFELNNLDLVVASPVQDYFHFIEDLPQAEEVEGKKVIQAILEALGEDYSACCEGTAFYPLQSCMNHSCAPNAKAFKREADRDGRAAIIALRPISKGEEITISYIDEELPFEERQASLADYGFECKCAKCLEEC